MKQLTTTLLLAAIAGAFSVTAVAQDKEKKAGDLSSADQKFFEAAAQSDLAEIQTGELAQQKGSSDEVKKLGAMLVKDHTKSSADLKSLAAAKGVTLPTEPSAKQKKVAESLQKLEGEKFDAEFREEQKKMHKEAIAVYEKAAKSKDAEVAAFAQKTLPTLKEHEQMAAKKAGDKADKADKADKKSGDHSSH